MQNLMSFSNASSDDVSITECNAPFADSVPPHQSHCGLNARALCRAVSYVEQHLGDSIKLDEVAKAALVSRYHFCRQFRKSTGQSPMEYIIRKRVDAARAMLFDDKMEICDIALKLGFSDQAHFTRVFHRITGFPPRRYVVAHREV